MKRRAGLGLGLLCGVLGGCPTATLDRVSRRGDTVQGVLIAQVPVRGFRVRVTATGPQEEGELLGVDETRLWILTSSDLIRSFPRGQIVRVRVFLADTMGGTLATWTTFGTLLSPLLNGSIALVTTPLWLTAGIGSAVAESASGYADTTDLDALIPFARFPQGPPQEITGHRVERPVAPPTASPPANLPWSPFAAPQEPTTAPQEPTTAPQDAATAPQDATAPADPDAGTELLRPPWLLSPSPSPPPISP